MRSTQNERLLWLIGMDCVKTGTHCKAEHLMAQHGKTRIYMMEVELKNKNIGS